MTPKLRIAVLGAVFAAVVGIVAFKAAQRGPGASTPRATAAVPAKPAALPRLLDLGAGKCIPCKAMAPILEELRSTYVGRLQVDFIDVWQTPGAAEPYRIGLIPTQIFFAADGRELFRHEGFMSREEILTRWKSLGVVID